MRQKASCTRSKGAWASYGPTRRAASGSGSAWRRRPLKTTRKECSRLPSDRSNSGTSTNLDDGSDCCEACSHQHDRRLQHQDSWQLDDKCPSWQKTRARRNHKQRAHEARAKAHKTPAGRGHTVLTACNGCHAAPPATKTCCCPSPRPRPRRGYCRGYPLLSKRNLAFRAPLW